MGDTADLVLYGMDSPPRALKRVLDRVTSVHVKDGLPLTIHAHWVVRYV
jgi:sugar phosphate isomerase/epimerase